MRICGSGASRHTTSGGLSPSVKVASLSSRNQGVVFAPSSSKVNMPGSLGTLGLGAAAVTPSMVLQVRCTVARVGSGCKVGVPIACDGVVGKTGAGAVGNMIACCSLVPVVPDCWACVGTCLNGDPCLVLCWVSLCSVSACTFKIATEDARALMISSIWSS